MNGAEALLRTLAAGGVDTLIANPGTSELHLVEALDRVPGVRPVLAIDETVCSGAADGYARMADKPAATLLHCGPGLANGLANFHNARRARVPVVSLVGDHATWHAPCDPPLLADIESLARPMSCWVRRAADARSLAADGAAAIAAALTPPYGVATLAIPNDAAWGEADGPAAPLPRPVQPRVDEAAVRAAAQALASGAPAMLLLGGPTLAEAGLEHAGRIAAHCGARLAHETFSARVRRGAGRPRIERVPYFPEEGIAMLAGVKHLIIAGSRPPVGFFGYPGLPSTFAPADCAVHTLAGYGDDATDALARLAAAVGAGATPFLAEPREVAAPADGPLDPASAGLVIGALLPEGALVAEEAITSAPGLILGTAGAAPHEWLSHTGGAIGQGLPVGTGAALACPDRKVVCLQADGSAMYSLQALWTQARERLDVVSVIFANRRYRILGIELARMGVTQPSARVAALVDLGHPTLDFVKLAEGLGVEAARADTVAGFRDLFASALRGRGPRLIEAVI